MKTMTMMAVLASVGALAVLSGCHVNLDQTARGGRTTDQFDHWAEWPCDRDYYNYREVWPDDDDEYDRAGQWWSHENPALAGVAPARPGSASQPTPSPVPATPAPDFQSWSPENPADSPGVAGK